MSEQLDRIEHQLNVFILAMEHRLTVVETRQHDIVRWFIGTGITFTAAICLAITQIFFSSSP